MADKKTAKQFVDEKNGLMIRVDKTLREMMEEKPSSRWDVNYWHPKYEQLLEDLRSRFKLQPLSDFVTGIQQGDVPRSARGDQYVKDGIIFINVAEIEKTGINWPSCKRIVESHYQRIRRAEPKPGDIIFVRSGKGSIGKSTVFDGIPEEEKIGISGHLNTVRFSGINSHYVECFLKSFYGQQQMDRFEAGTSQQTDLRQDSFSAIMIPHLEKGVQLQMELEYQKMSSYHDKAMKAKKSGNESEYEKNINIAKELLNELTEKTEFIISGQRKNLT